MGERGVSSTRGLESSVVIVSLFDKSLDCSLGIIDSKGEWLIIVVW